MNGPGSARRGVLFITRGDSVSRQRVRECAAAHTGGGGGSRDAAPNKEAPSASPPCET